MTITTRLSQPFSVIGFDFGFKKIGVAVGQSITGTASPIGIFRVEEGIFPIAELKKLLQTWKPQALIVGIPLNMDGTPGSVTLPAGNFAERLEAETGLPVYRVDERLTSRSARYELEELIEKTKAKRKDYRVDAFAACLIVETWLQQN